MASAANDGGVRAHVACLHTVTLERLFGCRGDASITRNVHVKLTYIWRPPLFIVVIMTVTVGYPSRPSF